LAELNAPFVLPRSESDYWLYAELFAQTCPVAVGDNGQIIGAVLGFRSQSAPSEVYLQDVTTHPSWRRKGVTRRLVTFVRDQAQGWGCQRLWLTSEVASLAAHATWLVLGFRNMPGDYRVGGVEIVTDYKGPARTVLFTRHCCERTRRRLATSTPGRRRLAGRLSARAGRCECSAVPSGWRRADTCRLRLTLGGPAEPRGLAILIGDRMAPLRTSRTSDPLQSAIAVPG
jgi:GNAT superfamily N-acetyltransferase